MRFLWVSLLLAAFSAAGGAAPLENVLSCPFLQEAPKIDGVIGKAEYFDAGAYSGLIRLAPGPKGDHIPEKFHYFLGHTSTHLYIAFRVYRDTTPRSSTPGKGENCGNEVWKDDAVEIMLDVKNARKNGVNLAMNAKGDYSDFKIYPPLKSKWNARWNYKARLISSGWEGELAIPWKDLETTQPQDGELWRFDVILNRKTPSTLIARLGDHPKGKWTDMEYRSFLRFSREALVPHVTREGDPWRLEVINISGKKAAGKATMELYRRTASGSYRTDRLEKDPFALLSQNSRKLVDTGKALLLSPYRKTVLSPRSQLEPGTYLQVLTLRNAQGKLLYSQRFPFRKMPPLHLEAIHALLEKGQSSLTASFPLLAEKAARGKIHFSLLHNGKLRSQGERKVTASHGAILLPHGKVKAGDTLTAAVRLYDKKGKLLAETRKDHLVPPFPAWQKKIPVIPEETVPYPWQGLRRSEKDLEMYARTYRFRDHVLPRQITGAGKELFREPPLLKGKLADGKEVLFHFTGKETSFHPLAYCAAGEEAHAGIRLQSSSRTEFDGFLWNEFSLQTGSKILRELKLVFRFPSDRIRYFGHTYKGTAPFRTSDYGKWGLLPAKGLSLPFLYGLWLGDLEKGFTLALESDRFWSDSGKDGAITITRKGEITELALNLLRNNRTEKGLLSFSFGLQATPVKPYLPRNHTDGIFTIGLVYQKGDPAGLAAWKKGNLGRLASHGGNFGILWSRGDERFGHPYPNKTVAANLRSIGQDAGKNRENYLYYCGWAGNNRTAEVETWQDEMARQPKAEWGAADLFKQCPAGAWKNMYLAGVKELVEKYGLCGVYMDQTTELSSCANLAHGCGYVGKDGKIHPTFPIREMRKFYRELYRYLLDRCGKDRFMIYSHNSTQPVFTPVDSFISRRCALEIFAKTEKAADFLSPDRIAGGLNPVATGIPVEATWWNGFHPTLKNNELMATLWLFGCTLKGVQWKMDSSFREGYAPEEHGEIGVLRALRAMDSPDLRFLPYWQAKSYRTDFSSSCWVSPKKRKMLLILSNLSSQAKTGKVTFSHKVDRLADPVSGKKWKVDNDKSFIMTIPAKSYRAVTMEY